MSIFNSLFGIVRDFLQFFVTAATELFDILSLTRRLADLVSDFLRMFGF